MESKGHRVFWAVAPTLSIWESQGNWKIIRPRWESEFAVMYWNLLHMSLGGFFFVKKPGEA